MRYLKYIVVALLLVAGLSTPMAARGLQDVATTLQVTSGLPPDLFTSTSRVCVFPLHVSEEGIAFIKAHEGFRFRPYRDHGHIWTVGYGFTSWKGRKVHRGYPRRITRADADAEFLRQLDKYEGIVRDSVCSALSQSAYDSLVSLAWNLGRINTTIVAKLDAADTVEAKDFLSTATVRGRLYRVLVNRRMDEYTLFIR
jgi:lysozyme